MRLVLWTDEAGYRHRSWLRDDDPDSLASSGVPCDPPDVKLLDMEVVRQRLHNALVDAELLDWPAVQASGQGLSAAILGALRPQMIDLYRRADLARRESKDKEVSP